MAKLSAHGRELARFEKMMSGDCDVLARRKLYSIRDDGAILSKYMVHFAAGQYRGAYWHDYGWKLAARPKTARPLEFLRPALIAQGFSELQS